MEKFGNKKTKPRSFGEVERKFKENLVEKEKLPKSRIPQSMTKKIQVQPPPSQRKDLGKVKAFVSPNKQNILGDRVVTNLDRQMLERLAIKWPVVQKIKLAKDLGRGASVTDPPKPSVVPPKYYAQPLTKNVQNSEKKPEVCFVCLGHELPCLHNSWECPSFVRPWQDHNCKAKLYTQKKCFGKWEEKGGEGYASPNWRQS